MKYTCEIIINKQVTEVVRLFDNPENLKKWMEGLESFTHISGIPGEEGAKSKLVFVLGKRRMEMTETIIKRDLPGEFSGTYEANGVFNIVKNYFIEDGPGRTRYITEQEFKFRGIMKLFGFLMPGAFKKQSMKYLNDFKRFAEAE